MRPEDRRSPAWLGGQHGKIDRASALEAIEHEAVGFGEAVTIGTITFAAALG